ncbi:hypothetical protein GCM10011571_06610 [Marinithermofilum abyssi]|uniref:HTH cro/C1-type domain-containing protein n=1 Tax=Marinithermofilum abyssi TaxID=1571185 RepID=A0A8J2YCH3_9BACL|nr:helix-turn-helix transcriptional regulator [Marinithermofilum abyssi]GGE08053.1 hypothetical protein GCM10011571_06610 [Marinithermofilum abyssi]
MSFPARLKALRRQRQWTQEQLGKKVNVTKASISCYEKGTRTPDLETLHRLADVLEVSTDYLLGRESNAATLPRSDTHDPALCQWFDELLKAPKECREELRKIWEIIKGRGKSE